MLIWNNMSSRLLDGDEVTAVQAAAGAFLITVHRTKRAPDRWHVSTLPALFDDQQLVAEDLDDAKTEATGLVRASLTAALAALPQ